ncbi:ADP-ribosylglycohydrolase family protein [Hazenella coriacea]|uniref:ADP-ribosylglycohydrolase n=1 Tax=Hazenella coriacea TaxID=1179467 RepID=A0A4R3L2H4_9BACL|nr:ADP-ribosylglycohydrolase family protein [Hazenella coriacea]TCS93841.1 ADP-ribosylglycohydrolase [Hazenella coriacea]
MNNTSLSKEDRVRGGFWGLLVGDALGVPYEFSSAEIIPPLSQIEMKPPEGFVYAYEGVPIGTWSDDGAQALCLLDSLLSCGKMDPDDFAKRICEWYQNGLWAVNGIVFDVGNQTVQAIRAYQKGVPALEAGFVYPDGKGNGALMRVLPLALWHQGSDTSLVMDAHLSSVVTHGHVCNQVCCALYCLWVRNLLEGWEYQEGYKLAVKTLRNIYGETGKHRIELEQVIRPDDEPTTDGQGYVVSSLNCARITIQQSNYEQVVKAAITYGHDTDTNAAIAGGLAGVRDGIQMIPGRWLDVLRSREQAERLLVQLLERVYD